MEKEIQYPYVRWLTFVPIICVIAKLIFVVIVQQASAQDSPEDWSSSTNDQVSQQYKPEKKALIYQYLLGNIAWSRGQLDIASEAMVTAARISTDEETTIRAYNFSIEAGKTNLAVEMAEQLLQLDPDVTRAQVMLLRAYIAANKPEKVFETMILLLEQSGSNMDLVIRYVADALGSAENPRSWVGVMDRLVDYLPDKPEVHLAHGFVAYKGGNFEKANASLNTALKLRPGWEEAAMFRLSWWNDIGNAEDTRDFSEEYLRTFPSQSRFQLAFARLLMQWGDEAEALDQFLILITREPQNTEAIFSVGFLHLQKERYQLAAQMFERYLDLEPNGDQARFYLARIAREEERYQSAMEWLSGIHGEQFRFAAQLEKGRVMGDQDRLDDALRHLAGIVPRTQTEQIQIYLTEEQLLQSAGQTEQALVLLNAALIDIPDDPDLLYARGLVTAKLKQLVQHERDMRRLIELQPENAHAYNALGYTLADESLRLDEALQLIERAAELRPEDPFILDSLGWVHYRLGNHSLALDNLRKAFALRADPEIAAHLGEVLWVQGRTDEAREVWQSVEGGKTDADKSVLEETIRRLDK